jgi:hypothetical protein
VKQLLTIPEISAVMAGVIFIALGVLLLTGHLHFKN